MEVPNWMPIIFYAVVLMAFLGIFAARHVEENSEQKPLTLLCLLTGLMLAADFVSRLTVYDSFPLPAAIGATYLLFGLLPVIGVYWYRFVRSLLSVEERTSAQRLDLVVFMLGGIGLATLVLNPFFGLVFSYDAAGDYTRGPLFFFPAGSAFFSIIIAEIFLITRVRSLGRGLFTSLLLFPIPPIAGTVIGVYSESAPWVPLGISIAMVILFAIVQTTTLNTDFLTGLSNRKRFEDLVEEHLSWAQRDRTFATIMVDLDGFKGINDTLGHTMGDVALSEAASILQRSVRENDIVARMGGDEFAILVDYADEGVVDTIVERIRREVEQFNASHSSFQLEMSMGYELFDPDKYADRESFLRIVDARMYADKQNRKAAGRTQAVG